MAYSVFKGTTSASVKTPRMQGNTMISNMIITNVSSGVVLLNLKVIAETTIRISPRNMELAANQSFTHEGIVLLDREILEIVVSGGSVDYYVSMVTGGID